MSFFFPEWMPVWGQFIILMLAVVIGICFFLMPFAVFGLKGRLNYVNQQLEDIQAQLRVLLKRTADSRERLQPRIQPVSNGQQKGGKDNASIVSEKKTSNTYIYPLSVIKKQRLQPVSSFSPENTGSEPYLEKESAEDKKNDGFQNSENGFLKNPHEIRVGHGDEQLYDPPSSLKEEKKEIIPSRKRAEPILRWPPR